MTKLKMFFFGIAAAIFALVLETTVLILGTNAPNTEFMGGIYGSLITLVLIEEILLGVIIWKASQKSTSPGEIFTGSIFVGVGFSFFEIFLNTLNYPYLQAPLLFSYLGLLLIHIATSSIFGLYFLSRPKRNLLAMVFIFFLNSLMHFVFNIVVLNDFNQLTTYAVLVVGLAFLYLQAFRIRKNYSLPIRES